MSDLAVCDNSAERLSGISRRYPVTPYLSLDDLLEGFSPLHFAVVSVPTAYHFHVAARLLDRGVSCLVEKPITLLPEQGAKLDRLASENGLTLAVGHVERFNPAVRALQNLVRTGSLGEIKAITSRRSGPSPDGMRRGDVNVLIDVGIHDVDIINFLLRKYPLAIEAWGGAACNERVEDFALINLDYGEAIGHVHADWITPVKIRQLEVVGTEGFACLEYVTQDLRVYRSHQFRPPVDFSQFLLRFGPRDLGEHIDVEFAEPLQIELGSFIDAISGDGGEIVPAASAIEALRIVTEATERIRRRHGT